MAPAPPPHCRPLHLAHGGALPCELQSPQDVPSFDLYKMTLRLQGAIDLITQRERSHGGFTHRSKPTPFLPPRTAGAFTAHSEPTGGGRGTKDLPPYKAKHTRQQPSKSSPVERLITTFCNLTASLLESFKVTTNQPFPMHNGI